MPGELGPRFVDGKLGLPHRSFQRRVSRVALALFDELDEGGDAVDIVRLQGRTSRAAKHKGDFATATRSKL